MQRPSSALCLTLILCASCGDEPNQRPTPAPDRATTLEDTPVVIDALANDSDPDGDDIWITGALSSVGEVMVESGQVRFVPPPDWNGTATFNYSVRDGQASSSAQITVEVTPVNDPPTAAGTTVSTARATAIDIDLAVADIDGDALTVELDRVPSDARLTLEGERVRFEPDPTLVGEASFTYRVSDGELTADATITVDVGAGAGPVVSNPGVTTDEDTDVAFTLAADDADGDAVTGFELVSGPGHGTLDLSGDAATYRPATNFNGRDSIVVRARDAYLPGRAIQIPLTVVAINDPPTAMDAQVSVNEDSRVDLVLLASDPDIDALTYEIVTPPAHGGLTGNGNLRTYRPSENYYGDDELTFRVSDGQATSPPATVRLTVMPVPDPPIAVGQRLSLDEDGALAITLAATDGDGDPLTYRVVTGPSHGAVTGTAPDLSYRPTADYHGSDRLTFVANDGTADSAAASIELDVRSVNDPPVVSDIDIAVDEDQLYTFTLAITDVDDTFHTISVDTPPGRGTASVSGTSISYVGDANQFGADSFAVRVSDGEASALATIDVTIRPVDDPPLAVPDLARTEVDQSVAIAVLDNDLEVDLDDTLAVIGVSTPVHGSATVDGDGVVTYAPAADFAGSESFTYEIEDSGGERSTGIVTVGVGEFPEDAPLALASERGRYTEVDLSEDGRFVTFTDDGTPRQVWRYDRLTGEDLLISASPAGAPGNGSSTHPSISHDGNLIAFQSQASDLVDADGNRTFDVFVRDVAAATTVRVSASAGGGDTNGASAIPAISGDGSAVAFVSTAFDLVDDDFNGTADVFVAQLDDGSIERVSLRNDGVEADAGSYDPSISDDGRVVAFRSASATLVAGDDNGEIDVFVRDLDQATTTRVSVSSTGTQANDESMWPTLSGNGRFVAFGTDANNLVIGTSGRVILVHDRVSGNTQLGSVRYGSYSLYVNSPPSLSRDGRYLLFPSLIGGRPQLLMRDRYAGTSTELFVRETGRYAPATLKAATLSPDGSYVGFIYPGALVPGTNGGAYTIANPRD